MTKIVPTGRAARLAKLMRREPETIRYAVDGKPVEIVVKYALPLQEACQLVADVADAVFLRDKSGAPVYRPELYAYALDAALLSHFTNVKTRMRAEKLYEFCQNTDVMEKVQAAISQKQYYELLHAIDEAVEDRRQTLLSQQRAQLEAVLRQLEDMTKLMQTLGGSLGELDTGELKTLFQKLSGWDEKKLVHAVVDTLRPAGAAE